MQEYEYYKQYGKKKLEAYQNLLGLPDKTKKELEEIEKKFKVYFLARVSNKRFQEDWTTTNMKITQVESLTEWYKKFKTSYHELFKEIQRRIKQESDLEKLANKYRERLQKRFEDEVQKRNAFNASCIKYLPVAFHSLLTMHPVKYEIYPTENVSPLAKLSPNDEELFPSSILDSLQTQMTASTISPTGKVPMVKPRTTTL